MAAARELIGSIVYWAAIALAVFGVLSAIMSAALFDGEERLTGAGGWAAFALGCYVVARLARVVRARYSAAER